MYFPYFNPDLHIKFKFEYIHELRFYNLSDIQSYVHFLKEKHLKVKTDYLYKDFLLLHFHCTASCITSFIFTKMIFIPFSI